MSRKNFIKLLVGACLVLPAIVRAGTSTDTVTINGTVAPFVEWATSTDTITIATPLSSTFVPQSGSVNLTLYANKSATITAAGGINGGVLTDGSAHTLTTKYKLTGTGLSAADGAYKNASAVSAGDFFHVANTYPINYQAGVGTYAVTLSVEMSAPGSASPESGNYTCDVVLTATF
jgi:hypothetical protein